MGGSIPSEWLLMARTNDMRFWFRVATTVGKRSVRKRDLPKVREIVDELWAKRRSATTTKGYTP